LKNRRKPYKNICAKRLFSIAPKRNGRRPSQSPDFRGFFFYGGGRISPERAVIMAKSRQYEGVSL